MQGGRGRKREEAGERKGQVVEVLYDVALLVSNILHNTTAHVKVPPPLPCSLNTIHQLAHLLPPRTLPPMPPQISRLLLVIDILHNATAPVKSASLSFAYLLPPNSSHTCSRHAPCRPCLRRFHAFSW